MPAAIGTDSDDKLACACGVFDTAIDEDADEVPDASVETGLAALSASNAECANSFSS
jgi:hypothetical protein